MEGAMQAVRKGEIAMWGSHTDECGRVSKVTKNGFYATYTSLFPREDRKGRLRRVRETRFWPSGSVYEGEGMPPAGSVKVFPPDA